MDYNPAIHPVSSPVYRYSYFAPHHITVIARLLGMNEVGPKVPNKPGNRSSRPPGWVPTSMVRLLDELSSKNPAGHGFFEVPAVPDRLSKVTPINDNMVFGGMR